MERIGFFFFALFIVLIGLVLIETKFPNLPVIKAIGRAIALLAGIAAIIQVLPIDLSGWLLPAAGDFSAVTPGARSDTASSSPSSLTLDDMGTESITPIPTGSVAQRLYAASLVSPDDDPNWQSGNDESNESGYDGEGYYIQSRKGTHSHFVVNQAKEFDRFALEVDVTLLTDSQVTAYIIVVGWQESGHGYLFVVGPDGQCGVVIPYNNGMKTLDKHPICPIPQTGQTNRVRVEVAQEKMKVFVNGLFVKEYPIDGYMSGFIGLGVLNYAPPNETTAASVRFNHLTIWSLP